MNSRGEGLSNHSSMLFAVLITSLVNLFMTPGVILRVLNWTPPPSLSSKVPTRTNHFSVRDSQLACANLFRNSLNSSKLFFVLFSLELYPLFLLLSRINEINWRYSSLAKLVLSLKRRYFIIL